MPEGLTPANPDGSVAIPGEETPQEPAEPQVDWELDDNPYKKRYGDSQSQIAPLVRTLSQFAEYDHSTKTWKPKATPVQPQGEVIDFDKELEAYDPNFRKVLSGYVQKQITNGIEGFSKQYREQAEYHSILTSTRKQILDEFGTEFDFAKGNDFNFDSPLYQLANEILTVKYAIANPDGSFYRYSTPEAERLATLEAYAILSKRMKQQPPQEKGKLGAIQGKGTKSAGVKGKLSYEDYSKLSEAEKDAYDMAQMGGKT